MVGVRINENSRGAQRLFHSPLLDMRQFNIANSALRASLAIYHLISNARSWNNCEIKYIISDRANSNKLKTYVLF